MEAINGIKILLSTCFFCLFFATASMAIGITVNADGKVWRQPVDFGAVTYNDLDAIFDTDTGLLDNPSSAVITISGGHTYDFSGLRWASIEEVRSLFDNHYGVGLGASDEKKEVGSSWGPALLGDFSPTSDYNREDLLGGIARTHDDGLSTVVLAEIYDRLFETSEDLATISTIGYSQQSNGSGAWMYEYDYQSAAVPEPATFLLMGMGLAAVAGLGRKKP